MIITTRTHFVNWLITIILIFSAAKTHAASIPDEVKQYIGNIKSIAVEFSQEDSVGRKAEGMLIIDKPFKFRCNYYEPFPIIIVGNKNYVSVYDFEMGQLSRIKSEENIFNFLLVDKVEFDNKFSILAAKEVKDEYVLTLQSEELNKKSEIWFNKKTKEIKKMVIFEENDTITLKFGNTNKITTVDSKLFTIQDPDIFGVPERFGKKELEKKLKLGR
ncbi:MAG: outer membrane lipoprotein carrier protein LolA [Rickettsiales bacterium]|nr:outer membrane lipoprotein carrier protein LolA [Rickettsiales bacterium]MCA0254718.1 outer-membrane lipoprotein carrier protein LolA [Pseudomonadota bacterium]